MHPSSPSNGLTVPICPYMVATSNREDIIMSHIGGDNFMPPWLNCQNYFYIQQTSMINFCYFIPLVCFTIGEIRLQGGTNDLEGRVEICLNNEWGTVCDQSWDVTDASVVCRQLKLGYTGEDTNYSYDKCVR